MGSVKLLFSDSHTKRNLKLGNISDGGELLALVTKEGSGGQ